MVFPQLGWKSKLELATTRRGRKKRVVWRTWVMELCGVLGGAQVAGWEPGWAVPGWVALGCVLVTVWLLLLGSMGDERMATAARGKWPNVNSSFWRWGWGAAVITARHEKMNRDLEKGGKRSRWGGGGGGGGGNAWGAWFQPSHRSLSITDSQGKNYTENRPGAGSAVHTSSALWSQTPLVTFSVPEALGKSTPMLPRARVLKMKLVEIHFPVTMEFHKRRKKM